MTGLSGRPAEGHIPDSRLVGEREERLREALEATMKVLDVYEQPETTSQAVNATLDFARAALASSPSPPDPDIVYKVEALILEHERNGEAFRDTDLRTIERRKAARKIVALIRYRGDES